MIVVLMGVSGSGKTTVGKLLAADLDWQFVDADDFHPTANVEKMRHGLPLNDDDRLPWLNSLREYLEGADSRGKSLVLACSALKHNYRDYLRADRPEVVRFVYLHGSPELIAKRQAERRGHFMPPGLLQSQFETLEPPVDAIRVDITPAPEIIAERILRELQLREAAPP
ncbi:Thermoresistant gluconokinase [Anatilimnocola aggregata]|uniref:Gluconokinase n=1 Tax=Anatilimnocola aggregata TaxID=2528021 RepID=A0A517YF06_9BACT|nr:gluconokinase [Anatilimnocola aggregata]QDU28808.1 Thermoresistant gluconokinase [Anatilimnocola aggregata]